VLDIEDINLLFIPMDINQCIF